MRKILLLNILVIVTAIFSSVNAAVVTEAEARAKANSFIAKRTTYKLMTKSRATQMQYAWDSKTLLGDNVTNSTQSVLSASVSNESTFYVYSNESSFVIVSGESTTRAILGFSNEGGISSVENLPAPMKEYLSGIDAEIKSVRANNNAILTPTAIEDELGEYRLLETAIWDQGAPFNKNASNGLSGCVPTAFAIIMRYHQWPLQGKVATLPSGSETIDLSSHTYDWSKMPLSYLNGYTEEQGNAVAQLMSDLGLSMGATYNSGSTDVNVTSNIGRKFQQNFDYTGEYDLSQKDVQYADNEAGWIGKIIESIDNNCPIPYSGTRTSGSGTAHYLHMFVLDGYSENNYFHFNWGWGGDGNGWFTLSTMGPSADRLYTQSNKAYFNLAPNKATYAISASASPATAGVVSINGGTPSNSATASLFENSTATLTAEANDGYTFLNWAQNGNVVSSEKTYEARVTSNADDNTYVANFVAVGTNDVTISVSYNSSYGSVTYNDAPISGTGLTVKENQEVTLRAIPVDGYVFGGWTVEKGTNTENVFTNELTFVAVDGIRISAEFSLAVVDYQVMHETGTKSNDGTSRSSTWTYNTSAANPVALQLKTTSGSTVVYGISNSYDRYYAYAFDSSDKGYSNITYTLSVPQGYVITKYDMTYFVGNSYKGQVTVANGQQTQTPTDTENHTLSANGLNTQSTSFTLSASQVGQQFISIEEFTVTIMKEGSSAPVVPTTYTVGVTAGEGGTATASASQVVAGGTVVLTAEPAAGYEFDYWSVGTSKVSEENPYTATITSDTQFVANFKVKPVTKYNVTVSAGEGGTASASASQVVAGGTVVLTAEPAAGYEFDHWSVGTSKVSEENPYTATITADTEFVANFNVVSSGGGGETPSYCEPSGDTYSNNYLTSITTTGANTNLEYTASSHPGNAHVIVPTVIEVSPGNSFTLNLVANSLGAGSSSVIREDIRYCHASLFTDFDLDGDFGSAVGKWGNNGGANNAPSNNVYGNYDEVMNIAATINVPANAPEGTSHIRVIYTNAWNAFPTACTTSLDKGIAYDFIINVVAENKYSVSVIAGTGGSATASASQVAAGESVTFTATPDDGYEFVNWTSGTSVVSTENPYTTTVTGDMELVANFQALPTYNVGVIAGAGGSATASSYAVKAGGTVTLTATPDDGYEFVNWTIGTSVVSTENPYVATITSNVEFVANFQESSQGGGSDVVEYCEPLGSVSRNDRGITTLDVSDDLGNSVSVSGLGTVANRALYVDRTTTILNTEPGATIYIRNNGAGAWMHSYVYVDFGNDGVFDVSEANCYNGNVDGDLVSHTGYTGVYSTTDPSVASDGGTVGYDERNSGIYDYNYNEAFNCDIPAFTLPLDIKPGLYRVRHKMDWNCIDPCGRTSDKYTGNIITNNAGGIIDFMINVRSTQPTITYSANTGGAIEAKDGLEATANTIESGSVIESDIYIILIPHQYNGKENTISSATISTMSGSQSLTIQNGENDGDVKEVAAVGTQPHYWYYHIPYTSVTESIEFTAMFEGVVQGLHGLYGDDFNIAVFDRTVSILNYTGDARIVNVEGQVLRSVSVEGTAQIELNKGVYFVVTANKVVKVMIK